MCSEIANQNRGHLMVPVREALTKTKKIFLVSFLENHGLEIRKLQIRNFKNFRKRI